jgi:hypothetical protein
MCGDGVPKSRGCGANNSSSMSSSFGPFTLSIGSVAGAGVAWYLYSGRLEIMPIAVAILGWQGGAYLYNWYYSRKLTFAGPSVMNINPLMQNLGYPGGFWLLNNW